MHREKLVGSRGGAIEGLVVPGDLLSNGLMTIRASLASAAVAIWLFGCGSEADSAADAAGPDAALGADANAGIDAALGEAVDLSGEMTPVKTQGSRNTCSVFAATAIVEYLLLEETDQEYDLSEQYDYWAAKEYTLTNDALQAYESMDALAGYLALEAYEHSSMLESEWPYESQNWQQTGDPGCYEVAGEPISECFTGIPPAEAELAPWTTETVYVPREEIGSYIVEHRAPVLINLTWYPEAVDRDTGAVHMPGPDEMDGAGGHVVALVGYDPSTRELVFRNSWGPTWGNNGYGTMPEDYILQYYEAAQWEPIDQYDADTYDMLYKSANGTTAVLVPR